MDKSIGEQLKIKLKELKMSVPDFSQQTGIPADRIYKWLKGTKPSDPEDHNKVKAFINTGKLEKVPRGNGTLNDSQPHYGTLPDYREKYIQSLERENSRLRADLEAIREKVLISLKGLSESERLILAMLKASLQLDVEREAKGDRKKLKDLQYKVSSQIDTNYAGHEVEGSRKGDKVEELP